MTAKYRQTETVTWILAAALSAFTPFGVAQTSTDSTSRIVASAPGFVVRESELDVWWQAHDASTYSKTRQDLYEGRRNALDALVGDYLLKREAKSRGITMEELLTAELPMRTAPVADAEIKQAYERALPLPAGLTLEQVRPMVASYLQQQHLEGARSRLIEELRQAAHIIVHLEAPRSALRVEDDDPARGAVSAPIQIVEFSDFQCPYCRQIEPSLKQLQAKYGDKLRLVWKDFPLLIHPDARTAAEAARCAHDQGRFWEYHDLLFTNQQALAADELKRYAIGAGLDERQFLACLERGTHRVEIAADIEEGMRHGVEATPTVFINGRVILGAQGIDAYEKVIVEELAR